MAIMVFDRLLTSHFDADTDIAYKLSGSIFDLRELNLSIILSFETSFNAVLRAHPNCTRPLLLFHICSIIFVSVSRFNKSSRLGILALHDASMVSAIWVDNNSTGCLFMFWVIQCMKNIYVLS